MDGVRVPALPELLSALKTAKGARRWIYIEIKTDPTDPVSAPDRETIVDAVFRDLAAEDYLDHAKIIAFDWRVLRLSRARHASVHTAHLTIPAVLAVRVKPGGDGRSPWADGFDARDHGGSDLRAIKAHGGEEWSPHFSELTEERVAEARALGLRVGPWGLSLGEDIRRMRRLGVDSSTVSGADWGP
jgi:glycerophosphoryl diester phosphodiesterase